MQITELALYHVRIPLQRRVSHASFSRNANDSLVVRCQLSSGEVGWGEGLPRPYVTGETLETAWDLLASTELKPLSADCADVSQVVQMLDDFRLPRIAGQRDCFGNSARCAVELAVLDAFLRAFQTPLRDIIPLLPGGKLVYQPCDAVRYSGVITSSSPLKALLLGGAYRLTGFKQCKLKVGSEGINDQTLVKLVRRALGRMMDLRVDANEAWNPGNLIARVTPLLKANLSGIEQPVPHNQVRHLAAVKKELPVPIILDESLCSLSDGREVIEGGWGDVFNIRLSKCGGFVPAINLAILAKQAGLMSQLGCQVGETGILTAAGRHFATGISDLRYIEGSFDRFLVCESLTIEDLTFGWGGRGAAINRPGLGVTVIESAVKRVTQKSRQLL